MYFGIMLLLRGERPTSAVLSEAQALLPLFQKRSVPRSWTHWGLNPGPSACEADVIPLHHVPLEIKISRAVVRRLFAVYLKASCLLSSVGRACAS